MRMAFINNSNHAKCALSVLKYNTTLYGKFYKFEFQPPCRTNGTSSLGCKNHNGDLIGPPHPVSNLRPIKFHIPQNEVPVEKEFRLKRQEVQQWNQDFWTNHNSKFVKERKEFVISNQTENSETPLSADEMSVFYKAFLDKNWRTHLNYNFEWYKKNGQLILLHLRVKLFQLKQRLNRRKKTVNN